MFLSLHPMESILLKEGYQYHALRKTFSKFYRRYYELISKFQIGLKSLLRLGLLKLLVSKIPSGGRRFGTSKMHLIPPVAQASLRSNIVVMLLLILC